MIFEGERQFFPSGSDRRKFDKFLAGALAEVRAPSGPQRLIFKDAGDKNLILVVGRRGATYAFKGRTRSDAETGSRKHQTVTIGSVDKTTLAQARARAEELRGVHAEAKTVEGVRQRRAHARAAALGAEGEAARIRDVIANTILKAGSRPSEIELALLRHATLSQCGEAYIAHAFSKAVTERRRADVSQHIRMAIAETGYGERLPGDLEAATISHGARQHSPSTGRKRVEALRVLYRWLKLYRAVDNNPAEDVPSLDAVPVRERYADAAELKAIWEALDTLEQPRADFVRLLILLPLRRGELAELRVGDVQENLGQLQLTIPKERSKNKLQHTLPLVGSAAEIVRTYLTHGRAKTARLLPLHEKGERFTSWKPLQQRVQKAANQPWFYFHMTRKMFATECVEHHLDDPSVIDGCLNHAANVGGHANYDFSLRIPRRATLLAAWERVVAEAVEAGIWPRHAPERRDNVISLGARV